MSSPLKIIFAGTPDFARQALSALLDTEHQIIAVYTQPDRPAGRGRKLTSSPVKQLAEQHDIPVYQPESFVEKSDIDEMQQLNADLMIVAAYGLLLPKSILDAPRLGCLNIHASLLPRWRGAAPIQRAILAGDSETGITIMQMDEGLDTGAMLLKNACPILPGDTGGTLHDRLALLGAETIVEALQKLDDLQAETQDNNSATYARKLSKQEAQINWKEDNINIERLVRAFNPWPVAYTNLNGKPLRIHRAQIIETSDAGQPGRVIACNKNGIDVTCGEGGLRLLNIQPPGKKAMEIAAFYNGYPDLLKVGTLLESQ